MAGREEQMAKAPMLPLIIRMSLPVVAAQLVNLLYGIVDRIFIGHLPGIGAEALAGVGVCGSVLLIVSAFSGLVGGGGGPVAAIALGRGDRERAEKCLGSGFTLLTALALTLTLALTLLARPLLRLAGADDTLMPYALEYLTAYLPGTLFVMLMLGLTPFVNCQGQPKISMAAVTLSALTNLALDPLLMFTFGLGVRGAAMATVIAQAAGCAVVLGFLLSRKASLRLRRKRLRPDWAVLGPMLALGLSPFVMSTTESLVGFTLNSSLAAYGPIYVSALAVMQSGMQLIGVPLNGFNQGAAPVVSYNYGRGDAERVHAAFRVIAAVMVGYNLLMTLAMLCFPRVMAGLFTDSTELIDTVEACTPWFLSGMLIFGLQRACQTMFVALSQPKISLFIAVLRKLILLIPLVLLLRRLMGVTGVYLAESIADATAALLCTAIFAWKYPGMMKKIR
ncbi:MAG: MATE family efflux transporter [Clostridia bacterium]|nr:MATE family efflux transporter [Clostridia bacterium]